MADDFDDMIARDGQDLVHLHLALDGQAGMLARGKGDAEQRSPPTTEVIGQTVMVLCVSL